ncbi:MAG TPA: CHAD domain-containing protein [Gaiellaceae bacterium]|nr:CHAD domain-containing protein [Gaiellaceae bacterium]
MIRRRADEIALGSEAGTPEENWLRAEREFTVAHDYDTADRDLERIGMTLSRLPSEAGVEWRLTLPRGERVEAWEPGTNGLSPPEEIVHLIGAVTAGKRLVPGPPLSREPGARRLRAMLEEQRVALVTHDPGVRVGQDPENLHRHSAAAKRTRALLRAARAYIDPGWRRPLSAALQRLGETTRPVRDLDAALAHLRPELEGLDETDHLAKSMLLERLEEEWARRRLPLLETLDSAEYRFLLARLRLPPQLADGVEGLPLDFLTGKEFRRLARVVSRLGEKPDEAALSRLRTAFERVRHVAELAAPVEAGRKRFLADAHVLQDLVARHDVSLVTEQGLRGAAVEDVRTAAAFAAGRLAERQRLHRERVQERLGSAWTRLRESGSGLV